VRSERVSLPMELVTSPSGWHCETEQETSHVRAFRAPPPALAHRRDPEAAHLAKKGMPLRAIAKALTRSEESVKERAKLDGLSIAKLH
jgi:DNA-binding NarL/FixJ family response regulator